MSPKSPNKDPIFLFDPCGVFLHSRVSCVWGVAALCTPFWRTVWTGRAGEVSWLPPASLSGGPMLNWTGQTLSMLNYCGNVILQEAWGKSPTVCFWFFFLAKIRNHLTFSTVTSGTCDRRQSSDALCAPNSGSDSTSSQQWGWGVVFFVDPHQHNTMQWKALQSQLWGDYSTTYSPKLLIRCCKTSCIEVITDWSKLK